MKSDNADSEGNISSFQSNKYLDEKLANLKYPNSSIEKLDDSRLILQSFDNPEKITSWYKEKINSLGMSTTSSNVIVSSDNVSNQLIGANTASEIGVDITKGVNEQVSRIIVTYR